MSTGAELVAAMRRVLFTPPKRYGQGPTRTTGTDGYVDCSGAVYAALVAVGFPPFPATPDVSSTQAGWCYSRPGGPIGPELALTIPGALLFMGPRAGLGGIGDAGHVAMSVGDGVHTLEARGVVAGVGQFDGRWRPWSGAGRVPGIAYPGRDAHQPAPNGLAAVAALVRACRAQVLRFGSVGFAVGVAQHRLAELGFDRAGMVDADPLGAVFGPATLAAVQACQHAHGLAVDGVIGARTWGVLYP